MNKKQKNRKLISQNRRNRIINRRYSSTIKTLSKLLKVKLKNFSKEGDVDRKIAFKKEAFLITSKFYSIVDKAAKKKVIHSNNAARKKSNFCRALSKALV